MKKLYAFGFFTSMWPLGCLLIVYFEQITNSYALASSIFTVTFLTQALFEIPTSVFSDKFTRKLNLIISQSFFVTVSLLFAIAGSLGSVLLLYLGAFFWGIRLAFSSGSLEALIYELAKDKNDEDNYDIYYAHMQKFRQAGLISAIVIAMSVSYFYSLTVLAYVGFVFSIARLVCAIILDESKSKPKPADKSLRHFINSLKEILANKKLRMFALFSVIQYSSGRSFSRFDSAYAALFLSDWLVACAKLFNQFCALVSCFVVAKVKKYNPLKKMMGATTGIVATGLVALAFNNIISPFVLAFRGVFTNVKNSSKGYILQKEYKNDKRATMDSVIALFSTFLASIMFSVIGYIADVFSMQIAMLVMLTIKGVAIIGYYYVYKKYDNIKKVEINNYEDESC